MRKISFAAILLTVLSAPGPALAEGTYHFRNDTGRGLNCGLKRTSSDVTTRFTLRPGAEWSGSVSGQRTLICFVGATRNSFYIEAGLPYALREDRNGRLVLRIR